MRWVLSEPCGLERLCTGGRAGNVWVKDHLDPDQEKLRFSR
jgi:hypothetical protein